MCIIAHRIGQTPRRTCVYDQSLASRHRVNLDKLLEEAGHSLQRDGNMYRCGLCGQKWARNQRSDFLGPGVCPRQLFWDRIGPDPELPVKLQVESGFVYGTQALHPSHQLMWLKGYVWCNKCGCLTSGARTVMLKDPCKMKPITASGHICPSRVYQLTRLRAGRNPRPRKPFPDTSTHAPAWCKHHFSSH